MFSLCVHCANVCMLLGEIVIILMQGVFCGLFKVSVILQLVAACFSSTNQSKPSVLLANQKQNGNLSRLGFLVNSRAWHGFTSIYLEIYFLRLL